MSTRNVGILLLLLTICPAAAAPTLIIGGHEVEGLTTSLVPGVSYAPVGPFADAVGATFFFDRSAKTAILTVGAVILQLKVFDRPTAAASVNDALSVNGLPRPSLGGLLLDGRLLLPVKPVIEALGGQVAFLAGEDQVTAVLPRATIHARSIDFQGRVERLVLELSAPVPYTTFFNEPLNTLQLRFERTDLAPGGEPALAGKLVAQTSLLADRGSTEVQLQLAPGAGYSTFTTLGSDGGYQLVIDVSAAGESPPKPTGATATRIVLDPGHGGSDSGLVFPNFGSESSLTLELARCLAAALERRGFTVQLTRETDVAVPLETRSSLGIGADLFLSLHAATLPQGQYAIYFLDDAASSGALDSAIRKNAAAVLEQTESSLRRQILLGLIPDLPSGRRYARLLHERLFETAGYRASEPTGLPLFVLSGAAGRGLLLEFGLEDLVDPSLPEALAGALAALLAVGSRP